MEQQAKARAKTIGWVRLQKSKAGDFFYTVSIEDKDAGFTTRAILRMDNDKIKAVKADAALVGKEVVGYLSESKFTPGVTNKAPNGTRPKTFTPRPAQTVTKETTTDLDEF